MNPWDAEATRRAIQHAYGREQLELARPCIRSLADRQFYAQYHYQRAEQTLKRYVRVHLKSKDFISISLGVDSQEWNRFNVVIRKLGADLTACVQSLHALPDVLASAVYYSLQLNKHFEPPKGRYVNHAFVTECLKKIPELATVAAQLEATIQVQGFKHLAALANQSKHYSIVFPTLNADLTGTRKKQYMLAFPEFKSGRGSFPQALVTDFLPPLHEHLSKSVVQSGHALNTVLQCAAQPIIPPDVAR